VEMNKIPHTYYARLEEAEKADGHYIFWLDDTLLLRKTIESEKKYISQLPKYAPGVFYPGYTSSYKFLKTPHDLDIDAEGNVFIADGFRRTIYEISDNGKVIWKSRNSSGGSIDIDIGENNDLYVYMRESFRRINKLNHSRTKLAPQKARNNNFSRKHFRFKVGKGNKLFCIEESAGLYKVDPVIYAYSFDGKLINKAEFSSKKIYPGEIKLQLIEIDLDAAGYIYLAYSHINQYRDQEKNRSRYRNGVLKLREDLKEIYDKELMIDGKITGLTITRDGNIVISDKNKIYIYDNSLKPIFKTTLKNPGLGKVDIGRIKTDPSGTNLFMIEKRYGRILRYDLIEKELYTRDIVQNDVESLNLPQNRSKRTRRGPSAYRPGYNPSYFY